MYILLDSLPLLIAPLLLYNFVVLTGIAGPPDQMGMWLATPVFTVHSFSGDVWSVSAGHTIIFFGLALLSVEIVKSKSADARPQLNHGLSAITLIVYVAQFLTMRGFTNSVVMALLVMQFFDVVAGYVMPALSAKRDRDSD